MFEIRIICDPPDTDHITKTLGEAFTLGPIRQLPAREGERVRLYVTAEARTAGETWPEPETAYKLAPSIISEIGWTARSAADKPFGAELGREFWLRKAAVLDRIALTDERDGFACDAGDVATIAARRLMEVDQAGVICDPRYYVRREYARWSTTQ